MVSDTTEPTKAGVMATFQRAEKIRHRARNADFAHDIEFAGAEGAQYILQLPPRSPARWRR